MFAIGAAVAPRSGALGAVILVGVMVAALVSLGVPRRRVD
jgi:hypothetical protein